MRLRLRLGLLAAGAAASVLAATWLAEPEHGGPERSASALEDATRTDGKPPPPLAGRLSPRRSPDGAAGALDGRGRGDPTARAGSRASGTVLDGAGKPIVGARVRAVGAGEGGAEASTDEHGEFTIDFAEGETSSVRISASGFADRLLPVEALARGTPVRLGTEGYIISGTITEAETGAPIGDVSIMARPSASPEGPSGTLGRLTEDGSFQILVARSGSYVLDFGQRFGISSAGEVWIPLRVDDVEAGTAGLEVRLTRGLSIEGRIEDEAGEPLPCSVSATVLARTPSGDPDYTTQKGVFAGEDGDFRVRGLRAGRYDLWVRPLETPDEDRLLTWSSTVVRSVEAGTVGLRITLRRGRTVLGRLEDGAGAPVLGAGVVEAWREGEMGATPSVVGKALGDGTFRVGPLDEGARFDLRATGFSGRGPGVLKGVSPRDARVVVVLPAAGRIVGRIETEDGTPPPSGVPVGVVAEGTDPRAAGVRRFAYSDEAGAFAVEGLADLPFTVEAGGGRSGYVGVAVTGVSPDGEAVVLKVTAGVTLSGTLLDAKGAPLATTSLEADDGGRVAAMRPYAQVGADGKFVLRGLRAGTVRLSARMGPEAVPLGEVVAPGTDVTVTCPPR